MRISVKAIKKGDRFFNVYWGAPCIATTDAYRLDGRLDPVNYSEKKPKPKVQIRSLGSDGTWQYCWDMIEVGVTNGTNSIGIWSVPEYDYIEVEREEVEEPCPRPGSLSATS